MRACVQSPPTPPLTPPPLPTHQDLAPPCHVARDADGKAVGVGRRQRQLPVPQPKAALQLSPNPHRVLSGQHKGDAFGGAVGHSLCRRSGGGWAVSSSTRAHAPGTLSPPRTVARHAAPSFAPPPGPHTHHPHTQHTPPPHTTRNTQHTRTPGPGGRARDRSWPPCRQGKNLCTDAHPRR